MAIKKRYIEYLPMVRPVLEQAIHDYLICKINSEEYKDARKWLFTESESDYPFSCKNICETLGLNIKRLRYEINCLMDKKQFKNVNPNRYVADSDFSYLMDMSEGNKWN